MATIPTIVGSQRPISGGPSRASRSVISTPRSQPLLSTAARSTYLRKTNIRSYLNVWIECCLKHDAPLLGICQGVQQMARVLGAEVGSNPGEPCEFITRLRRPRPAARFSPQNLLSRFPLSMNFSCRTAPLRALSPVFHQQAFQYGANTFAFQFHAEGAPRPDPT